VRLGRYVQFCYSIVDKAIYIVGELSVASRTSNEYFYRTRRQIRYRVKSAGFAP